MYRIKHRVERAARWSKLKGLGGSNLARVSVLMPAFGYMLLLNQKARAYLTIEYDGRFLNHLPVWLVNHLPDWLLNNLPVWRMWFLFYGSFILATATILYSVSCPRVIKLYRSGYELAAEESPYHYNSGRFGRVVKDLDQLLKRQTALESRLYRLDSEWPRIRENFTPNNVGVILNYTWEVQNVESPRWRVFILLLFCFGMVLVALPAVVTFVQVTALWFLP